MRFIVELESGKPTVRLEHVLRVIAALGGELVLSGLPVSKRSGTLAWGNFFELLRSIEVPPDFMAQREHNAVPFSIGVFDSFVSDATPGTDSDRPIVSVP